MPPREGGGPVGSLLSVITQSQSAYAFSTSHWSEAVRSRTDDSDVFLTLYYSSFPMFNFYFAHLLSFLILTEEKKNYVIQFIVLKKNTSLFLFSLYIRTFNCPVLLSFFGFAQFFSICVLIFFFWCVLWVLPKQAKD